MNYEYIVHYVNEPATNIFDVHLAINYLFIFIHYFELFLFIIK